MKLGDEWFTSLAETEEGDQMIIVCGRDQIRTFTESGKFKERWKYHGNMKQTPMVCRPKKKRNSWNVCRKR